MQKDISPFFSIIMPVYNAEKYLAAAIESVLVQTCQDFELILVEDHSTDGSCSICQQYAEKYDNIVLCRTEFNKGVANARNLGVKAARGVYVTFVDSDDSVEMLLLQTIKDKIDEHASMRIDIIKYSIVEEYYDNVMRHIGSKEIVLQEKLFAGEKAVREHILPLWHATVFGYLCTAFYRRETLNVNQWEFDANLIIGEDVAMNLEAYMKACTLLCLSYIGYHYNRRMQGSLSSSVAPKMFYENYMPLLHNLFERYNGWNMFNEQSLVLFFLLYIKAVYQTVSRCMEIDDRRLAVELMNRHIFEDKLFYKFMKMPLRQMPLKAQLMGLFLKHKQENIIIGMCRIINFVKKRFRMAFVHLKG
ncbi:glycosyltransferase family 2 protein [uncultured Selenomonas sp.]|uniref:glycosyltransferase family 2 protein n=1 Tax=uncultured Selenomonas sp. TaxID=159275 RepID=UPI0028EE06B4|nr:glycosyltransferase family 2 protein [uncultured Selenomonas sp.]